MDDVTAARPAWRVVPRTFYLRTFFFAAEEFVLGCVHHMHCVALWGIVYVGGEEVCVIGLGACAMAVSLCVGGSVGRSIPTDTQLNRRPDHSFPLSYIPLEK